MSLLDRIRTPRRPGCPAPSDLHAWAFDPESVPQLRKHLSSCRDCARDVEGLVQEHAAFLARHPAARLIERLAAEPTVERAPARRQESRRSRPPWLLAAPAVAALLGIVFMAPDTDPTGHVIRLKGSGVDWTVFASRDGRPALPIEGDPVLRPGDVLSFGIQTSRRGFVLVVNLDGDGRVTRYYPGLDGVGNVVSGSHRMQLLPGSVRLDGYTGLERIALIFSEKPVPFTEVRSKLLELYGQAGGALTEMAVADLGAPAADVEWLLVKKTD